MSENATSVRQDARHPSDITDDEHVSQSVGDHATSQLQLDLERGADYARIVKERLNAFLNGEDAIPF